MAALADTSFTGLLVDMAGAAVLGAAGWLLLVGVAAVVEAATAGRCRALRLTGCPVVWRVRLLRMLAPVLAPVLGVLGTTGYAVAVPESGGSAGGRGSTPTARGNETLDGLPLPELPGDAVRRGRTPTSSGVVVVRAGDTLWGIADRSLPADASLARVAHLCRALYRTNREVVGTDPDLIRPGQRLRLPPNHEEQDR